VARQLVLELVGDASKLSKSLNEADGKASVFSSGLGKLAAAAGGWMAGAKILDFGKDAVAAFTESAQAQSKLELALKNSSATVGVHASEFAKLNTELAKHVLVDDDVIAATEAQMATFGASKDQIRTMIPTVLDFAAKMGIDAPAAADLFDKASLGSAKALKTLGIEGYKPTGDKATDLANIQGLLKDKVAGAAQAQLDAAGPGAKLNKSMDELKETAGKFLVPALQAVSDVAIGVTDFFATHPDAMLLVGAVAALTAAVWAVNTATAIFAAEGALATAATSAWAAAQWVLNAALDANPIALVVIGISALIGGLVLAYQHSETFRAIVQGAFGAVKTAVEAVVGFFKELPGALEAVGGKIVEVLTWPYRTAFNIIAHLWNDTVGKLAFDIPSWVPGLGGKGFSMPNLPTFHSGGVVPGQPGTPVPILAMAGETVLPAGRGGGGITIYAQTNASARDIADELVWSAKVSGF
jgi:hypothetical protein